jgi:hypothetical protein
MLVPGTPVRPEPDPVKVAADTPPVTLSDESVPTDVMLGCDAFVTL